MKIELFGFPVSVRDRQRRCALPRPGATAQAAQTPSFGCTRRASRSCGSWRWPAIRPMPCGREARDGCVLGAGQEEPTRRTVIARGPGQLRMDVCLWSRAAASLLIERQSDNLASGRRCAPWSCASSAGGSPRKSPSRNPASSAPKPSRSGLTSATPRLRCKPSPGVGESTGGRNGAGQNRCARQELRPDRPDSAAPMPQAAYGKSSPRLPPAPSQARGAGGSLRKRSSPTNSSRSCGL